MNRSQHETCVVGSPTLLDRVRLEGAFTLLDEEEGEREEKGRAEGEREETNRTNVGKASKRMKSTLESSLHE